MADTSTSERTTDVKSKALSTYRVFTSGDTILGMPSQIFVMGAGISLVIATMLFWVAGILFAMLYFYGMYTIHKDDPKAFYVWKNAYVRQLRNKTSTWKTSHQRSTRLDIL
jgi:type IV secretory pathway VirB3-like protein